MTDMADMIKTSDLTLIATLQVMGFNPEAIDMDEFNPRRRIFSYANGEKLQAAIKNYELGKVRVEPRKFSDEMRNVKNTLLK